MESGQIQRQLYWGRAVGRCHLPPCVQQMKYEFQKYEEEIRAKAL